MIISPLNKCIEISYIILNKWVKQNHSENGENFSAGVTKTVGTLQGVLQRILQLIIYY